LYNPNNSIYLSKSFKFTQVQSLNSLKSYSHLNKTLKKMSRKHNSLPAVEDAAYILDSHGEYSTAEAL